jgi:hypothetical protein
MVMTRGSAGEISIWPILRQVGLTAAQHDQLLDLFEAYIAPWLMVSRLSYKLSYESVTTMKLIIQVVDMPSFRSALSDINTPMRNDDYSPLLHLSILGNAIRLSDTITPGTDAALSVQASHLALQESERPMLSTVKGLSLLGSLHTVLRDEDLASLYFGMSLTISR